MAGVATVRGRRPAPKVRPKVAPTAVTEPDVNEEVTEMEAVETQEVENNEEVKEEKVQGGKETMKATAATKKAPAKSAPAKATTKKAPAKGLDLSTKKAEPKVVVIGEAGTLKRDELLVLLKDRLMEEHGMNIATLENASRIVKTFEGIIGEALEKSNTIHLCGRNFNRKKVKARVFTPPIGDGASYLVAPHYKMSYNVEISEKIKGSIDEAGNFVAEDGTTYTAEDIQAMDVEFFGEE